MVRVYLQCTMVAYYNEFDPYAAQWLRNLIADGLIPAGEVDERSILDVRAGDLIGYRQCHFFAGLGGWPRALRLAGWPDDRKVWTGSCPCQPFSLAGSRKGQDDERHLWPAWFALIMERRPAVVFGEQVAAAIGRGWLDEVFADLEGQGYACAAAVLPACAVGAPHRRDRLWFVADARGQQYEGRGTGDERAVAAELPAAAMADADVIAGDKGRAGHAAQGPRGRNADRSGLGPDLPDAHGARLAIRQGERSDACAEQPAAVGADWWSVEPDVGRVAHGIPARVGKLRALGNAIVPQVAAEFVSAYLDIERVRLEGVFG